MDWLLPGPGSNRGYAPSVFVDRLILMLQAGGQCLEDLREWTREAGRLRLLGRAVIPDPDTLGDWLRRRGDPQTGQAGLVGLGQVRDELTARLLRRDGHTTYTLDADATLVGGEKRDAQWSYTGVRGYMPMLGFLWETPVCLVDEFREGNVSPGAGQLEFYRPCRARMPVGKRLARYRANRASYQAALINELEEDQVRGAITADQDVAVKAVIAGVPAEAWQEPEKGCGYQVADTVHTMNATRAAFRLSLKREERPQPDLFEPATGPYAYPVVASHWPTEEKPAHAGLGGHPPRGQAENSTKNSSTGWGWSSCRAASRGRMRSFSGSGCWRTTSSWVLNAWPVPPRGRRRRSPRCGGNWGRWPDGFSAMRGRWSCDSCWRPRRSPVGAASASSAGHWAWRPDAGGRRDTGNRWRRGSGVPPLAILQRAWPS